MMTDAERFEAAWWAARPRLRNLLLRRYRDPELVDDALAETVIDAWRQWGEFVDDGRDTVAWLARIALRNAFDRLRAQTSQKRRHHGCVGPVPEDLPQPHADPATVLANTDAELAALLDHYLSLAPPWTRPVLARTVAGEDAASIASSLGTSPAVVYVARSVARKKIQEAVR